MYVICGYDYKSIYQYENKNLIKITLYVKYKEEIELNETKTWALYDCKGYN